MGLVDCIRGATVWSLEKVTKVEGDSFQVRWGLRHIVHLLTEQMFPNTPNPLFFRVTPNGNGWYNLSNEHYDSIGGVWPVNGRVALGFPVGEYYEHNPDSVFVRYLKRMEEKVNAA